MILLIIILLSSSYYSITTLEQCALAVIERITVVLVREFSCSIEVQSISVRTSLITKNKMTTRFSREL